MNRGFYFAVSKMFKGFFIGGLVAVFTEFLIYRNILMFLGEKFYFSIFSMILVSCFLNMLFPRKNVINYLFINGCSRKKISKIKILSVFMYNFLYFLIFLITSYFLGNLNFSTLSINEILEILLIFISICFVTEFSNFLILIYRIISMKKGKGVFKDFYRYSYSFIFIILVYTLRYCLKFFNIDFIMLSIILALFTVILIILILINRKRILKIDIRL